MSAAEWPWQAIAALTSICTIIITTWLALRGGQRFYVTANFNEVMGSFGDKSVYAHRIKVKNHGRHISKFEMRISLTHESFSCLVANAKTLDPKTVKIERKSNDCIVRCSDLPAGEWLHIDLLSPNRLWSADIRGGSSQYSLISSSELLSKRLSIGIVGALIALCVLPFIAYQIGRYG